MNKNLITLALALSLTACGTDEIQSRIDAGVDTNTAAVISDLIASASGTETTVTGTLAIEDDNAGEAAFIVQDNEGTKYGTFSLAADGSWTYTFNPENADYIEDSVDVDELIENILVKSVDSTRQILVITIPAAEAEDDNTAAIIAGVLTGAVTEDAEVLTATGTATVTDEDADEDTFVAETVAGMYGSLTIAATGAWTYTLANDNADVQALDAASTPLVDTVAIESADGTASAVVITISGADEVMVPTCDSEILGVGGIAFATDDNLAAEFAKDKYPAEVWNDDLDSGWTGSTSRASDGVTDKAISGEVSAVFKLADISKVTQLNLLWDKGNTRTTEYKVQTAKVYSADDSTWTEVLAQGNSTQLAAEGFEAVTVTETDAEYIRITGYQNSGGSGWISLNEMEVIGCASDETSTAVNTDAQFTGDITGEIDNDEATVTGSITTLDLDGDTLVAKTGDDVIDGDYGTFDIIADGSWTYTLNMDDTLVSGLAEGEELEDSFSVEASDGSDTDVDITIVGAAAPVVSDGNLVAQMIDTSTSNSGEIRINLVGDESLAAIVAGQLSATLMIQDDADSANIGTSTTIDDGVYVSLYGGDTNSDNLHGDIIFTSSNAVKWRDASKSQQTVSGLNWVSGTPIQLVATWDAAGYSFSIDGGTTFNGPYVGKVTDAVESIVFKVGSGSKVALVEYNVDDIVVLDDTTEVFSEDFDTGYSVGDDLSSDYSSSKEATVQEVTLAESNNVAQMIDTSTSNSGEIRVNLVGDESLAAIVAGQLSATLMIQDDADSANIGTSTTIDDGVYVSLYGGDTNSDNLHGDIIFTSSNAVKWRDASKSQQTVSGLSWVSGTPIQLVATWDAAGYSFSIDGGTTFNGPYVGKVTDAVESIVFKVGSGSKVALVEYNVDDIVVLDGSTEVFSEDFETGYSVGDDLSSDYSSSKEATVQDVALD